MKKSTKQGLIRRKLIAVAVTSCFAVGTALANPTGANVVRGTAAIHQAGNLLQITNSPNAIINWQSFSIGANEITRFLQQSSSSAVLNRVITQNPSQILGALQSNGRVFLINPNGILFGAGAQVDVAGLVASTLNLSDQDFLAGRLRFTEGLGKSVVNDGSIATGPGGSVYLIGSGVTNNGIIRSPQGEVVLAAGNSVELVSPGTPNLRVEITATDNEARNLGQIISEAGRVGIYAGLINHSGTIRADSAQLTADGRIVLKAIKNTTLEAGSVTTANGPKGGSITIQSGDTTLVSGTVEATGSEAKGGRIDLLGERVGLINAAAVDVSGKTGGGSVLVGGDYQGGNPDVQNAARTYVGREVEIRADAIEAGDGGKVILWADGDTRYYGSIRARGGETGGDGGFVEVSGKVNLDFVGKIDVAAPLGTGGKVLLDPQNIMLNATVQAPPPNNAVGTPDVAFADPPAVGTTTVQIADVTGYDELFLQATNDITVASAMVMAANGTVRLEANNNININAALTTSGTPSTARPSITLTADADTSGAGTLTLNAALSSDIGGITLSGATIAGVAAGTINSTGGAGQNGGNINVSSAGVVNLAGAITSTGGANAGGAGFNAGTVTISGTAVTTGAITAAGSVGAANSKGGSGGDVTVTASNGNITVGAISTLAGNTLGTGATGATVPKGGNVSLTTTGGTGNITATTISTSGATGAYNANAGGNGGNVTLDASAAGTATGNVVVTTVNAFAGLGATGSGTGPGEGRAGGTVLLTSKGTLSFGAVNTRGTAAVGVNQAGGAGGAVTIDSTTGAAITYTGAAAAGIDTRGANGNGTGIGGLGGAITLTDTLTINNNFVAVANSGTVLPATGANILFGDVLSAAAAARTFTATTNSAGNVNAGNIGGAGAANSMGTVIATGRSITTGSVNTTGRNNAAGAGVTFTGQAAGTTTVNGTITTVGGTNTAAGVGRAGGNINLSGGTVVVNGAINTSGSAAFAGSNNNGGNAGTVTLNATGATPTVTLGAGITANGGAAATAGAAQTGGNGGNIQIQDPSLLTADVVVSSLPGAGAGGGASGNGGTVTFTGVVNSSGANRSLAVNTPNTTTFTAAIGGTLALTSLTTDAGTGATSIAGNVTTTGAQTFNDAVTLAGGGTRTFASTGNNAITFASTVNGASNLVVNTTGATTFTGAVGGTTALTSVTTNGGGTTSIGGDIRTSGAQSYNDAVTLTGGGTRTFLSTGNAAIAFNSTLDGGSDLTVNTTGITTFGTNVGSTTALTSVTTNAGAGVTRIGGNVTTTGTQTFNDAVVLTGNAILTGSTPTFGSTVTGGGFDLTLDFSGATTVNGATFTGIRNLATGNGGTTNLTGSITTTGTQTYNDAVSLIGATTLASGNTAIAFNNTVDGGQTLAVNTTGATTFGGVVGGLAPLTSLATNAGGTTAINGGAVTTTGAQSYGDTTTLGSATTLQATAGGDISASGAVTATGGTLTLSTSGNVNFNNSANDFSTVAASGANVVLTDSNAIVLDTIGAAANLVVTAGGHVTQSGVITVAGAAQINLTGANTDALLGTQANDFAGGVAISPAGLGSVRDVSFRNVNAGAVEPLLPASLRNYTLQFDNAGANLGVRSITGTLSVIAAGAISQSGALSVSGTTTLAAGPGNDITLANASNDFSSVAIAGANNVSLVDGNALTIGPSSVGTLIAQTLSGDLALGGNVTATGSGDTIVLAAAANFDNTGGFSLAPGAGRWLVYSTSPAGSTEGGLTAVAGSALPRLYNRSFGSNPPGSITEPGNHLIYSAQPALAVAPDNKTKAYGTNDPAQTSSVTGYVNDDGVLDTAVTAGLTGSFGRVAGETAAAPGPSYAITQGTFASGAGYSITFDGTRTLTITAAPLAATIANQSKVYGANDPALAGIGVSLAGIVNTSVTDWNGTVTALNDTGNVSATLASLTRTAGETVGGSPYAITGGTLNALSGSAAGNYSASLSTTGNALSITPAALAATIANQTKIYGANDPALAGIPVTLGGVANNPAIVTWNGNVSVNDTGNVSATLASLARAVGETVTGSPYAITGGTLNALSGSAAGNYTTSLSTAGNTLSITPASLAATIANQTKTYGSNDPALAGIPVTLGGVVNNPAIVTWNGNVSVNDTGNVNATLASLARTSGETVTGSPYAITGGTLNALTGSAAGNYSASLSTAGNSFSITAAPLSFALTIPGQTKVYGADDPALGGIAVNLTGLVNNPAIVTWNGNVAVDDSAVTGTLTSLARAAGEIVAASPYAITAGTVTLSASDANYAKSFDATNSPQLAITPAALSGTIANQTKVYGTDDPALAGIPVTLGGVVNNPAIVTWNGNVSVNDTGNVNATLASLTRAVGETVTGSPYAIAGGTLNALTGTAAGNYTASLSTAGNTLAITPAALSGTIANQTKIYGADDPALAGIPVTLGGLVSNPAIVTWNGNVSVNDTGNVNATLASLTRAVGEMVTGSPYAITGGTLNALTGSAAGNYSASLSTAGNSLAITPAALTGTIANQNKVYGADDPALGGIAVNLTGLVNNPAIVTWNGNVAVDDSALTSSVTSLARTVGEGVGGYNITAGTLSAPSGNYSAPTFTGTPTLMINPAALSFALITPGQTKVYGADDAALGGIAVNLTGLVNNPAIVTWNGNVAVDDSAVTGTLTSLARAAGEIVAASPYAITAGAVTLSASNANYAKSFDATNSPQLAITPAALSVTANAQGKTYGAPDPTLTFSAAGLVSGTVNDWNGNATAINDTAASALSGALVRAAGETVAASPYAITQGTLSANADYTITAFTGSSLAIAPAPLTITADDATRPVSQPNPPFNASYSAFQFGETPAALTGTLSYSTPATIGSPAGPYAITPFGQSSTNYAISYIDGTLTVFAATPAQAGLALTDPVVASLGQLGIAEPYAKNADCTPDYVSIGAPGACGGASVVIAVSRQPRGGIQIGSNGEILLVPGLRLRIAPAVDMGALRGAPLQNPPAVESAPQPGVGLQIAPTLTKQP